MGDIARPEIAEVAVVHMNEGEAKDQEDLPEAEVKVLRSGKKVGEKPAEDPAEGGSNQDVAAEADMRPVKELAQDADQLESLKITESEQKGEPQSENQAGGAANGGVDESEKARCDLHHSFIDLGSV